MAKKSPRRRLITGLQELELLVAAGRYAEARLALNQLRTLAPQADAETGRRINLVLDVHDRRLTEALQGNPAVALRPKPQRRCRRCGLSFDAGPDDKTCGICRPTDVVSVRTLRGGLPGSGRRH